MPLAVNPSLFALGFVTSTAALHILGVIIGYFGEQSTISSRLLRIGGVVIACIGVYALAQI
jgi:urease accessory protein